MNVLLDFISNKDNSIYVYIIIAWVLINIVAGILRFWQLSKNSKCCPKHNHDEVNDAQTEAQTKKSDPKLSDADYLTAELQQLSVSESASHVWLAAAEQGQYNEEALDKAVATWRHSLERLIEIKRLVDEKAEELVADMSYTPSRTLHPFFERLKTLIQQDIEEAATCEEPIEECATKKNADEPLSFVDELKQSVLDRNQHSLDSGESTPKNEKDLDENAGGKKLNRTPSKIPVISPQASPSVFTAKSIIQHHNSSSLSTPNFSPASIESKLNKNPNHVYMDELRERISQRSTPDSKAKWSPSPESKQELCVGGPLKSAQRSGSKLPVRGEKKQGEAKESPNKVAENAILQERVRESIENYVADPSSQNASKVLEPLFKKLD